MKLYGARLHGKNLLQGKIRIASIAMAQLCGDSTSSMDNAAGQFL